MSTMNRRELFCQGLAGLAAVGVSSLSLRADAEPTDATTDVHDYQAFLDEKGIPQVSPAGEWEPSYEDVLGPFYLKGAPFRGKVTPPLEPGDLLVIRGRVWGFDTKKPVPNAVLDVWQADAHGNYDMTDLRHPPARAEFKNRIRLVTDETGYYEYETIRPAGYRAGPGVRPAHIHYLIQAPRYQRLVTQLYFKGDPDIQRDRSARDSNLVIATSRIERPAGSYELGTFDIVLARS